MVHLLKIVHLSTCHGLASAARPPMVTLRPPGTKNQWTKVLFGCPVAVSGHWPFGVELGRIAAAHNLARDLRRVGLFGRLADECLEARTTPFTEWDSLYGQPGSPTRLPVSHERPALFVARQLTGVRTTRCLRS